MNDPFQWFRLYVLPVWLAATVVALLVLQVWGVAAIGAIATVSAVFAQREQYRRRGKQASWSEDITKSWTDPAQLGIALPSGAVVLIVAVVTFGFSIGVLGAIGAWAVIFGLWLRAILRRSKT